VLVNALHEAGLPKGVFNVVPGLGTTVGAELVRSPMSRRSHSGSVGWVRHHARRGRDNETMTLELAESHPPSFSTTPPRPGRSGGFVMAFMNSGQACAAGRASRAKKPVRRSQASNQEAHVCLRSAIQLIRRPLWTDGVRETVRRVQVLYPPRDSTKARRSSLARRAIRMVSKRVTRSAHGVLKREKRHDDRAGRDFGPVLSVIWL